MKWCQISPHHFMIIVYRVYMFRSIIAHKESCTIRKLSHILISAKSLLPTFITCKKIIQGAVCNSFVASFGINADKHYVDPVSDQVQWRLGVIWDFIFCRKFVETFNPFLPPFFDSDICHTCPICNTAVSLHLWQCYRLPTCASIIHNSALKKVRSLSDVYK